MAGPLAGIKVVDLTTVGMGPYATQTLGDMGAEIVKVESPEGDTFRDVEPARHPKMGAAFLNLNRNKQSIVLNIKSEEDRAILHGLLDDADVFVTNTRPNALRKLGLDYESMSATRKRLIYCSLNGFAEAGPHAGKPAFDDIIQAMSGLAWLQGANEGRPAYMNTILADKVVGLGALAAINMALFERERSGLGQAIEVPMYEFMVCFTMIEHMAAGTFPPAQGPAGYARVLSPYRKPYQTSDGFISLLPYTTAHWRKFFIATGRADLAEDPELLDPALRSQKIDLWYARLADMVLSRTTADWLEVAAEHDIPIAVVQSPDALLEDEYLRTSGILRRDDHPFEGAIVTTGLPITFSRTPGSVRSLAPRLDEHGNELREKYSAGSPRLRIATA